MNTGERERETIAFFSLAMFLLAIDLNTRAHIV